VPKSQLGWDNVHSDKDLQNTVRIQGWEQRGEQCGTGTLWHDGVENWDRRNWASLLY